MSQLTTVQTEDRLREAVRHHNPDCDDEFLPIPLKRIDSGPHQHRIQDPESETETDNKPTELRKVTHNALINEIDGTSVGSKIEVQRKTGKKENTLTRMLKGIKLDKSNCGESEDKLGAHVSISKIFQRINPVGKASRENFSKVFHRIGDALQKKSDLEECSASKNRERRRFDCPQETKDGDLPGLKGRIGEKMFRYHPVDADTQKTTD